MNKEPLRIHFKKLRSELPTGRRIQARETLFQDLFPILAAFKFVLSFASLPDEIDTRAINEKLAEEGRLALPRIVNGKLQPYRVSDLSTLKASHYNILEPTHHEPISQSEIECILVPGLCFTSNGHRIGFGKGHYDRFLAHLIATPKFGIGFKEQLIDRIPIEEHDIQLTKIFLF